MESRLRLPQRICISMLPGVKAVGLSTAPPIDSAWGTASFHIAGRTKHGENEVINRQVSSDYFRTLQARLWKGRYFAEVEDASKPLVVIIDRTLADKYFPGEDPIGKQIYYDWAPRSLMQVVGIVDDIKEGPLEDPNWPFPLTSIQLPGLRSWFGHPSMKRHSTRGSLGVSTSLTPSSLFRAGRL
jgi:macrolide transport system ATP-binding/permease protein